MQLAEEEGISVEAIRSGTATPQEQAEFLTQAAGIKEEVKLYREDGTVRYRGVLDVEDYLTASQSEEPIASDYGTWIPGVPVIVGAGLEKANTAPWMSGLILDGIVAGVGAVLGFVPQMLVFVFIPCHFRILRLYVPHRVYFGSTISTLWSKRKILYSHADLDGLWCAWYHGKPHD